MLTNKTAIVIWIKMQIKYLCYLNYICEDDWTNENEYCVVITNLHLYEIISENL